jgi:hypothetical protein
VIKTFFAHDHSRLFFQVLTLVGKGWKDKKNDDLVPIL